MHHEDMCVVTFAGEVDSAVSASVVAYLSDVLADGARLILVDLAEITFFAAAGITALLNAKAMAEVDGGRILLVRCSSVVSRVLELTHVRELFEPQPTVLASPAAPHRMRHVPM